MTNIPESEFRRVFPLPFCVRALTCYEVASKPDILSNFERSSSIWEFTQPFEYNSDRFGNIYIEAGELTDFASIPKALEGVWLDNDSPVILFASAAHDKVCRLRGNLQTELLTPTETNELLTEAMYYCGANPVTRAAVFAACEMHLAGKW